jgi:crotonobetainyl-CoA:carnitine CoA-transferase CaiB-like acyl-CoA transferase
MRGLGVTALLGGIKVVDFGVGMAPALVAKMMADLGAQVTRVPPAGGDPFAAMYPAYAVWHSGATYEEGASIKRLEALLADADICILGGEDHPDLVRRTDAGAIAERFPKLVVLDIGDGPKGTDYAGRPTTELLAQSRAGLVWEQRPDRPIVNAFEPAQYGAALQGVIGILAAVYEREGSGQGQLVSTSLFEGALAWIGTYWATLEKPTPAADFVIPRGVVPLIFKAKDGVFVQIVIGSTGSKYGVYKALEIDDPTVTPESVSMPQPGGGPRMFFGDVDLLAEHVAKLDSGTILERIWAQGLPAEPILPAGACWDNPQIERNGIIHTDPDGTRHVGLPFLVDTVANGAPRTPKPGRMPLEGVRVIDCGAFVAGPLGSVILADLGAEVIKVEANQGDPNRAIFKSFTVANRGKKGLSVDLKAPEGKQIVMDLCAGADVVMNNFRPGVSARLGIDPKTLHAGNPSLIVLESPAYGSEGPLALKSGFDMVMQAWCGHEAKAAGRGNDPLWNRTNIVDFAGGMLGAVAMLAALVHRARTGEGATLELPLVNAGIFGLSELIQRADGSFAGVPELGPEQRGYHPAEALYQTADGWVVVVARGDKAGLALRDTLGLGMTLGEDVAQWGEAEEKAIAGKLKQHESADLIARLEPAGIWIETCRDDMEKVILHDPVLIEKGIARAVLHPSFGVINELGGLVRFSRSQSGNQRAAPLHGGSTRDILAEAGHEPAQIDDLLARRVVLAS